MGRNYGFIKAEEHNTDVKAAFKMGLWTGGSCAVFGCAVIVASSLYYLGAFHQLTDYTAILDCYSITELLELNDKTEEELLIFLVEEGYIDLPDIQPLDLD